MEAAKMQKQNERMPDKYRRMLNDSVSNAIVQPQFGWQIKGKFQSVLLKQP
jgi:hypothetical protein